MLRRPPQHAIDAPGLFVFEEDEALDLSRVNRERARMADERNEVAARLSAHREERKQAAAVVALGEAEGDALRRARKRIEALDAAIADDELAHDVLAPDQHPFTRYYAGETRYDLDAKGELFGETVRMRDYLTGPATIFRLRRLTRKQFREVAGLFGRDAEGAAELACRYGLVAVEGLDGAGLVLNKPGLLTRTDLDALHEIAPTLIDAIGMAAWLFSQPLSEAEKKRYAPRPET